MTFRLQRCSVSADGVFGMLSVFDRPACLTLERPWKHNEQNISCIPSGIYDCYSWNSQKFGKTWQIGDVPGRQAILIHTGNVIGDSQGCILIGHSLGMLDGQVGIMASRKAMDALHDLLPDNFKLEVYWPQGFNPKD